MPSVEPPPVCCGYHPQSSRQFECYNEELEVTLCAKQQPILMVQTSHGLSMHTTTTATGLYPLQTSHGYTPQHRHRHHGTICSTPPQEKLVGDVSSYEDRGVKQFVCPRVLSGSECLSLNLRLYEIPQEIWHLASLVFFPFNKSSIHHIPP